MDTSDAVDPTDAKIQGLLAQLADMTTDTARRDRIVGLILTLPPIAEWPAEAFEECRKTYEYVRGLRRDLEVRQLKQMFDGETGAD